MEIELKRRANCSQEDCELACERFSSRYRLATRNIVSTADISLQECAVPAIKVNGRVTERAPLSGAAKDRTESFT